MSGDTYMKKEVTVEEITDVDSLDEVLATFSHMEFLTQTRDPVERRKYAEKLLATGHAIAEFHDGKPMGMMCFYCNDVETRIGYITMFALMEELGFAKGRTMFNLAKLSAEIADRTGMEWVRIEVDDNNVIARKLYERMGFEYTEKKEHSSIMKVSLEKLLGNFRKLSREDRK